MRPSRGEIPPHGTLIVWGSPELVPYEDLTSVDTASILQAAFRLLMISGETDHRFSTIVEKR